MSDRKPKSRARGRVPLTYYRSASGKKDDSNPKKRPKNRGFFRVFLNRTIDLIILGSIIFGLVYSMVLGSNPEVNVSSQAYRPSSSYQSAATDAFGSIKNHNKISLDEDQITKNLQSKFPEISNLQIELPLLDHTPKLHITISVPSFVVSSGGQLYIIDTDGIAVGLASSFPGVTKGLPVITDQSSFKVTRGKPIMSGANVNFTNQLLSICKSAKIPVKSLSLPVRAQELDLQTADQPYYVKFFLGGKVDRQAGQFMAARHQFEITKTTPSQYLDARVEGKVFYK